MFTAQIVSYKNYVSAAGVAGRLGRPRFARRAPGSTTGVFLKHSPCRYLVLMELEQLRRLMDQHSAAMVLYARQWCADAEDVVQEALIKLVRQRVAPERPLPWLYRVIRNAAISSARARQRRRKHEANVASRTHHWFVGEPHGRLDAEEASQALMALPIEQREVVIAHLWSELTFEEIAPIIGASSSTAHRLYQTGLATLRERLEPCTKTINRTN